MKARIMTFFVVGASMIALATAYLWGRSDERAAREMLLTEIIEPAEAAGPAAWSPTKPYPTHDVYYPGTEALERDDTDTGQRVFYIS